MRPSTFASPRVNILLSLLLLLLSLFNYVSAADTITITKTATVTKLTTITREITSTAGAKTTTVGTTTIKSTRTTTLKASTKKAVPTSDREKLTLTITSTETTTLAPSTITANALSKRQLLSRISELFDPEVTKTDTVTKTVSDTITKTLTTAVAGDLVTKFASTKTETETITKTPAAVVKDDEPEATGYAATTTVTETETVTPDPVIVTGSAKSSATKAAATTTAASKEEEEKPKSSGLSSGAKAGIGATFGILGAIGIGAGIFFFMRKRRSEKELSEEEKGFNTHNSDPSIRGGVAADGDGLAPDSWAPPPQPTSTAAIAAGAVFGGAAAARAVDYDHRKSIPPPPQQQYSPPPQQQYSPPPQQHYPDQQYPQQQYHQQHYPDSQYPQQPWQPPAPVPIPAPIYSPDSFPPRPSATSSFSGNTQMSAHPSILTPGRTMPTSTSTGSTPSTVSPLSRNSRSFTSPDLGATANNNRASIYAPASATWVAQNQNRNSRRVSLGGLPVIAAATAAAAVPEEKGERERVEAKGEQSPPQSAGTGVVPKRKPVATAAPKYTAYKPGSGSWANLPGGATPTPTSPIDTPSLNGNANGAKEMVNEDVGEKIEMQPVTTTVTPPTPVVTKPEPKLEIPPAAVVNGDEGKLKVETSGGFSPPPVERKEDVPAVVQKRNSAWEKASEYM